MMIINIYTIPFRNGYIVKNYNDIFARVKDSTYPKDLYPHLYTMIIYRVHIDYYGREYHLGVLIRV